MNALKLQTRCGTLEYVVSGAGRPAIVLFNGAGMTLAGWRALYPRIEQFGAVVAWNRFGIEGSDAPDRIQSGAVVIASVRELLHYAGIEPPYVLVGHSLGGLYANLFARLHPDEVGGVLMLEATHPRDHEVLQMDETHLVRALRKVLALPDWLFRENLHSEVEAVGHVVIEVDSAGDFPDVPVTVITGGMLPPKWIMDEAALEARLSHQHALAHLSKQGEHVIAARSGHFPQLTEPDVVLEALARLVKRSRRAISTSLVQPQ
ncbi:MAG TPA: alpha/beta hydrolase [Ramlibacter sp.]|nr:alpha/beta hydrolase [Ramlibacter sp.]